MILYNTYLNLLNNETYLGNVYITYDALTADISNLIQIDNVLDRALNYCELCLQPCSNC